MDGQVPSKSVNKKACDQNRLTRVHKINSSACHFLLYSVYSQEEKKKRVGRVKAKQNKRKLE